LANAPACPLRTAFTTPFDRRGHLPGRGYPENVTRPALSLRDLEAADAAPGTGIKCPRQSRDLLGERLKGAITP